MSETKRCPQCQMEIPAAAPEGLCPQCLLQAGLESKTVPPEPQRTAAYTPSGSGFVPPTPAELQPAFPQLEILELLGKGGMGAVYKAKQRGLDRLVAVKILPPEYSQDPAFAERFLREAKALAMLSHPNIVGVHDVGQAGGYCYFIMEFVDGVNLRQAMRAGTLKPAEALKIVPQICDALQFAHDEGIVHRDIKPENILLDKKGRVKIADFGLAKLLGKTPADVSLTGTQQVMGTMHYMAPEQIEGARDVDHRADIYSLGVTFYEMLTGELPIGRFAAPSKKVQIDVRLDEVVLRSLEKEPEQRYQHASEIKTEVEGIVRAPAAPFAAADADADARLGMGCATVFFLVLSVSSMVFFAVNWGKDDAKGGLICGGMSLLGLAATIFSIVRHRRRNKTGIDFKDAMAAVEPMTELEQAVLRSRSTALAVMVYREKTGADLAEAKAAVEKIAEKYRLPGRKTKVNLGHVLILIGAGVLLTLILLSPFVYAAAAAAAISVQLLLFGVGVAASFLAFVAVWKEWWQSPSPFVWKVIRTGLLLASLFCLWCLLSSRTMGGNESVRFEIGFPSPWLRYWPVPGEGFQINPGPWSLLALVVGWLAFWGYRRSLDEGQPAAPTRGG